ncbi:hypothetical protein [Nocardioides lijunqiniae]|uniref:hypothetical protein n=1 Tax=Nocardioides lijunqiniae TaxID=2760832 RepID=UPI001877896E|nr:hypothetical protein [Nocardioides lijunqiniae]
MSGLQRVLVVSTSAGAAEVAGLRASHGRDPLVLTAPTAEAKRVVLALGADPQVEVSLAPVRFPPADRGHRLDELVRRHALRDRFRDVVVVVDPATATLLLRTLAPDQLPTSGAVTLVGLPRGDRPVAVRRAVVLGVVLGVVAAAADPLLLLGIAGSVGLVLLLVPPWRHLGRELLLAAAISAAVALALVSSSGRFPGGW